MEDKFRARIHPELVSAYDNSNGFDFDNLDTFVPQMNAMELANLKDDPQVEVYDRMIAGPKNAPEVKLRIYRPKNVDGKLPALLFFHGGGFLFGSVYRQENLCQRYAKEVGCVVVSVEYRLAPLWKAPAPVEDGYSALCWVHENAGEIGVDAKRIALAGLSAGGTTVASLSMMSRDRGGPEICLQMPLYGEMDWRLQTSSMKEITSPKIWCYDYNKTSWDLYLGEDKEVDGYDCPSISTDLKGLPPLFSYVGELDPVRDENMTYWSRMMEAGIPVEGHIFPGAYHCFELSCPMAALSQTAYTLSYAALRRAFGK